MAGAETSRSRRSMCQIKDDMGWETWTSICPLLFRMETSVSNPENYQNVSEQASFECHKVNAWVRQWTKPICSNPKVVTIFFVGFFFLQACAS